MGLKGQLEDLPLIDMLQIIAFSKKSGYLRVAGSPGKGAVFLKEGRVLFAYSWSTASSVRALAQHPDRMSSESVREQIESALRELAALREGTFRFELTESIAEELGGVELAPFLLADGLDPQELLLDLAVEIDNERKEATTLLELAFRGDPPPEEGEEEVDPKAEIAEILPPAARERSAGDLGPLTPPDAGEPANVESETKTSPEGDVSEPRPSVEEPSSPESGEGQSLSGYSIVVVDDEPPVTEVVSQSLREKGLRVFTASSPGMGADVVRARVQTGESVLAVIDLKMPTSSGQSFYGGFELIRHLRKKEADLPILLMVEGLTDETRARARALGIRRLVYKPTLTKPDPDLYRADLKEFAESVREQLEKLMQDGMPTSRENGNAAAIVQGGAERMSFLAAMTRKLVEPGSSTDVSRLVLQVAGRFLERGILFVVKGDGARGLAAFGVASGEGNSTELAQSIAIEIARVEPLSEVVRTGKTFRSREPSHLDGPPYDRIGRGRLSETVWIPMLYNRAALLVLYGDNGVSGCAIEDLDGLELFMAQAGMAIENKLLQRKLSAAGPGDSEEIVHGLGSENV